MQEQVNCNLLEGGVQFSNGAFKRNIILNKDEITNFRTKYNNCGIFLSAYSYSSADQSESSLMGDLYFDFDAELISDNEFNLLREDVLLTLSYLHSMYAIPSEFVDIYFSGNKGIHLIVKKELLGIKPHDNLNQIFRGIAEEIAGICPNKTMDMKIYDRRRLWRVANSKHNKSGLYKIPITLEDLNNLSLEDIKSLAVKPRILLKPEPSSISKAALMFKKQAERVKERKDFNKVRRSTNLDIKRLPPCIDELANGNVQKGQRNNSAMVLASFFKQQGASQDDCLGKMSEWNNNTCEEPLPQREIDMVVSHVYEVGYSYGCTGLRTLATCNKRKCPFFK